MQLGWLLVTLQKGSGLVLLASTSFGDFLAQDDEARKPLLTTTPPALPPGPARKCLAH